jgi:leucyl aminopeptidase
MDITDYSELHENAQSLARRAAVFPSAVAQKSGVTPLLSKLSASNMQSKLTTFVGFNNRYYKSSTGKQSSAWLLAQVQAVATASGVSGVTVRAFSHPSWTQDSVIATIPGKSANIIAIGAHQDSVNGASPMNGRAPGADDDGSGSVRTVDIGHTCETYTNMILQPLGDDSGGVQSAVDRFPRGQWSSPEHHRVSLVCC